MLLNSVIIEGILTGEDEKGYTFDCNGFSLRAAPVKNRAWKKLLSENALKNFRIVGSLANGNIIVIDHLEMKNGESY